MVLGGSLHPKPYVNVWSTWSIGFEAVGLGLVGASGGLWVQDLGLRLVTLKANSCSQTTEP